MTNQLKEIVNFLSKQDMVITQDYRRRLLNIYISSFCSFHIDVFRYDFRNWIINKSYVLRWTCGQYLSLIFKVWSDKSILNGSSNICFKSETNYTINLQIEFRQYTIFIFIIITIIIFIIIILKWKSQIIGVQVRQKTNTLDGQDWLFFYRILNISYFSITLSSL
jgi:hypothetical protein